MSITTLDLPESEESDLIFRNYHYNSLEFDAWIEQDFSNLPTLDYDGDSYFNRIDYIDPETNRTQLCTVFVGCSDDDTIPSAKCLKCQISTREDDDDLVCSKCTSLEENKRTRKVRVRSQRSRKVNQISKKCEKSNTKPYQCKYCDEFFSSISSLLDHVKIHSQKRCNICNRSFCSEAELKEHSRVHYSTSIQKKRIRWHEPSLNTQSAASSDCKVVETDKTSSYLPKIISPKPEVSANDEICTCSMCGTIYSRKNLHICMAGMDDTQSQEQNIDEATSNVGCPDMLSLYKCVYCSQIFDQIAEFSTHMATHDLLRQFQCKFCGQSFQKSCLLLSHVQTVHMLVQ